jgi:hypothetical protein
MNLFKKLKETQFFRFLPNPWEERINPFGWMERLRSTKGE